MSSKPADNMAFNAEKTQSQGNLHPISEATLSSSELYLDELTHGVTGTIIFMICRSWDVHTITGLCKHGFRHVRCEDKLYLSSGSSTQILDDPQIPALKELRAENIKNEVSLSQAAVHADYSQAKEGTLENLLIWARNRKNDVRVKIDVIRTRKGWNFPSYGGEKCKKGVMRKDGSFWCQACDKAVEYPVLRFRLELDVSDKTASTVVVMFDEPTTELLKCSTDSLAAADKDVGLTYADDVGIASVEEDVRLSNVNTTPNINIKQTKRLTTKPTVATPSKPTEGRGKKRVDLEDSDEEDTCGMDDGQTDSKDSPATMDNDSVNMDTPIASRSNILHKSFNICSRTIITRDGKVQSYYGLKLTNIDTQASEVATLITNDFGDGLPSRDIVVDSKDGGLKRISELHLSYMALQYPLLFPYGEDGFHENIPYHTNRGTRKTKRGYISMKEYYAYIIQLPKCQGNTLLRGGRLYQQYLVDAYTTVEEQRLQWTRNNQDTLRVDIYHNLNDAFTRGDTNAEGLGKRINFPRTFTGGLRYIMKNYQDAMALCRAYRNPYLFITFTSNPKWPEIGEMLAFISGQKPYDRPKVGTQIFRLKLTHQLDDLTKMIFLAKLTQTIASMGTNLGTIIKGYSPQEMKTVQIWEILNRLLGASAAKPGIVNPNGQPADQRSHGF
ncbi:ATP-dependent DNA helicase PIF1-like protein [Tanacetum coccineum]